MNVISDAGSIRGLVVCSQNLNGGYLAQGCAKASTGDALTAAGDFGHRRLAYPSERVASNDIEIAEMSEKVLNCVLQKHLGKVFAT